MTYHNTTNEAGETLREYEDKASGQDDRILSFFGSFPTALRTPWEILDTVFIGENVPITSIRRSMSNLTRVGLIEKTDVKREGRFGRQSYCWKLALDEGDGQGKLF